MKTLKLSRKLNKMYLAFRYIFELLFWNNAIFCLREQRNNCKNQIDFQKTRKKQFE